jgi:hypothetical protein
MQDLVGELGDGEEALERIAVEMLRSQQSQLPSASYGYPYSPLSGLRE